MGESLGAGSTHKIEGEKGQCRRKLSAPLLFARIVLLTRVPVGLKPTT